MTGSKRIKNSLCLATALIVVLSGLTAFFLPVRVKADKASVLKAVIEAYSGGSGATGQLTAAVEGQTVTVTGSMSQVSQTLELAIDADTRVLWKAKLETVSRFSEPGSEQALIKMSGQGTFELAGDASLIASLGRVLEGDQASSPSIIVGGQAVLEAHGIDSYAYEAIRSYGDITVKDQARLFSFMSSTVHSLGAEAKVTISGGQVTSEYGNNNNQIVRAEGTDSLITVGGTAHIWTDTINGRCIGVGGRIIVDEDAVIKAPNGGSCIMLNINNNASAVIRGGTLESTSNSAITCGPANTGSKVEINGGTIKTVSGSALSASGTEDILIIRGGHLTSNTGTLISTSSKLTLEGGTLTSGATGWLITCGEIDFGGSTRLISMAEGRAINATREVRVTGGLIAARQGEAIRSLSGEVSISGGLVFAYGDRISGAGQVIYADGSLGVTGTGLALAWNQAAGITGYQANTSQDLIVSDGGTALWGTQGGQGGVYYTKGSKQDFLALDQVTVINSGPKSPVNNLGAEQAVTYQGQAIDLSQVAGLFILDPQAGQPAYSLEGGSGAGILSLNGSVPLLDISRAGTFFLGLETAETVSHQAGAQVTATLTVVKGSQAAPASPGTADATSHGGNDGMIMGLESHTVYEYRRDSQDYQSVVSDAYGRITGLPAGTYRVRLAGNDLYEPGDDSPALIISQPVNILVAQALEGVTSPAGGQVPHTGISDGMGFAAQLSWDGSPALFEYGAVYTATITLTAKPTYTFGGNFGDDEAVSGFTVNGQIPSRVNSSEETLVIRVTFPQTAPTPSQEKEILTVISPADAQLDQAGALITALAAHDTDILTVDLTVSDLAVWGLYSDPACQQEVAGNILTLLEGQNRAYVQIRAEDGSTRVYDLIITREAPPAKTFQTLTDPGTGISLSGYLSPGAYLTVSDLALGTGAAEQAIRQQINDSSYLYILGKDIRLTGDYSGLLTITLPLGSQYTGKTVSILHARQNASLSTYSETVQEGKVTLTVDSLSPFAVFQEKSQDQIPATGADGFLPLWGTLLILLGASLLLLLSGVVGKVRT